MRSSTHQLGNKPPRSSRNCCSGDASRISEATAPCGRSVESNRAGSSRDDASVPNGSFHLSGWSQETCQADKADRQEPELRMERSAGTCERSCFARPDGGPPGGVDYHEG